MRWARRSESSSVCGVRPGSIWHCSFALGWFCEKSRESDCQFCRFSIVTVMFDTNPMRVSARLT